MQLLQPFSAAADRADWHFAERPESGDAARPSQDMPVKRI